jgi:hypothetical protein
MGGSPAPRERADLRLMRPYRLIATDDPCRTFGQGKMRHFATMLDAANEFVKAPEPYRQSSTTTAARSSRNRLTFESNSRYL